MRVFLPAKLYGFKVDVDLTRFAGLSNKVSAAAGRPLSWHKSLVGEGVFTHEAGIHVDGLLKHPLNYHSIWPKTSILYCCRMGRAERSAAKPIVCA